MKRTHTQQQQRYGHHERASMAVRFARFLREATKAIRLQLIAMQEKSADDHFAHLAEIHELTIKRMVVGQRRRVQLAAKRQAVERGVA